ncbi:MAG: DNA mismatch endonuclease Vsr [Sphingopyxis sp.]|uniref:very short patch repair endonuclease n=1 Tax=Sphingopyxis sp. TaxID=1908224 RepID=UPI003D8109AB
MAKIGPRDTKPEMVVRRKLHELGRRFRLHRRDLPGTPDIVLPAARKVIFVHGCFWHRHEGCRKSTTPKTRVQFWQEKFARNIDRDRRKEAELRQSGWDVLTVWECETRDPDALEVQLRDWLTAIEDDN